MPLGRLLDSALRHTQQCLEGVDDGENHAANAAWNLMAFMHIRELIARGILPKELNDLPDYRPRADQCGTVHAGNYVGKAIRVEGGIGRICQWTDMTPPDHGIVVDIECGVKRENWCFPDRASLEKLLVPETEE